MSELTVAQAQVQVQTPRHQWVAGTVAFCVHLGVVWGLLSVKVPQMPSTPVAPIQVEWIELASLATASDQSQLSGSVAVGDTPTKEPPPAQHSVQKSVQQPEPPKPNVVNPPSQPAKKIVKPKTEPKPKAKLPILTDSTPNTNSWTADVTPQNEPKDEPKDEPKIEPKSEPKLKDEPKANLPNEKTNQPSNEPKSEPKIEPKDEPKSEPKSHASTAPAKDNGKQGDDKTSDKTSNQGEPKGDKQGTGNGDNQTDKGNGNANQGEKDGKSSAQTPSNGNNSHSNAGTGNSPNPAKSNALEQNWTAKVRAKIERSLNYPDEALSKKWSGTPTLKITIDTAGNVLSVSVVKSSGKAVLDDEAIATAQRASPLPVPPDEIMNGQASKSFRIPVRFDLKKHQ